jgi:hypothetical protein
MKVYTFSSGGCRDGFYLESLSTTKEGVKDLIRHHLIGSYVIDECETIRDILIDDRRITVIVDDLDLGSSYTKVYELIIFDVL